MGKRRRWDGRQPCWKGCLPSETGRLCLKAILENDGIKTHGMAVRAARSEGEGSRNTGSAHCVSPGCDGP